MCVLTCPTATELGPYSMQQNIINSVTYLGNRNGVYVGEGYNPLPANNAGAIQAVLPHPTDPNKIWIGSVNGGVWRTTDGGSNWTPLTDSLPSLSISHLSFDFSDSTHNTIIASVGLCSNGFVGGSLVGVYITTNGGSTWTVPAASEFKSKGIEVQSSFKSGNTIISCMRSWTSSSITKPIYYSTTNGVGTWTTKGPLGSYSNTHCTSLVSLDSTTFVAAFTGTNAFSSTGELWMSSDIGASWAPMTGFSMSTPTITGYNLGFYSISLIH